MLPASPITRQTVGKTFTVSISVLGAAALLQVVVVAWAFVTRAQQGVPASQLADVPYARLNPQPAAGDQPSPNFTSSPFADTTAATSQPAPSNNLTPPRPTPATQRVQATAPSTRFEELIAQGKELRDRGDLNTAVTKFKEAGAMEPNNPIAIAELAATFEASNVPDRAGEQWRRIYDMGARAGVYYSLAEAKLRATQVNMMKEVNGQGSEATPAPPAAVDLTTPVEGIADGALLGLLPVTLQDQPDDAAAKHFLLHIPMKARPRAKVEVRDLVIHVLFYDLVDGQNVVQTSAEVNTRWASPPPDWTEGSLEELAVEYRLPKPDARAAKRENRKYFGYIVRIYYKQQLQAATAEPERLAQQYPPPPTLLKDSDK
jgi:hypothetical protein